MRGPIVLGISYLSRVPEATNVLNHVMQIAVYFTIWPFILAFEIDLFHY